MRPDWVSFEDALQIILAGVRTLGSEEIPLSGSLGRILATDLISPIDLPLWTNSAMDGYALSAESIRGAAPGNPVELPVVDDIAAGSFPARALEVGEAARIMTGAPVPEGADSVVRVEFTEISEPIGSTPRVRILNEQDAGRNLRYRGEELSRGDIGLPAGSVMTAPAIGMAASLGFPRLPVIRRPLVALFTSGDELVEVESFEEVLAGRRIVSSNSYTLAAQLAQAGCDVRYLGIAGDSPEEVRASLLNAEGCDALITSAGISVGDHDFVRQVLIELGAEVSFWRVRIKPGSPFAFGSISGLGGIPWFGLPGNPVSSAVTFELLARPALLRMGGNTRVVRRRIGAALGEAVTPAPGLTQFLRVRLRQDAEKRWVALTTGGQGSGILSSMSMADGLLVVPPGNETLPAGHRLEVIPLESAWLEDLQAPFGQTEVWRPKRSPGT